VSTTRCRDYHRRIERAETKIGEELVSCLWRFTPFLRFDKSDFNTDDEAGVQTDDAGNLAVMGTTAALLSVTIDGISSVGGSIRVR